MSERQKRDLELINKSAEAIVRESHKIDEGNGSGSMIRNHASTIINSIQRTSFKFNRINILLLNELGKKYSNAHPDTTLGMVREICLRG